MDGWCMDSDLNNNCVRTCTRYTNAINMGWILLTIRRYFSQRLTRENNHFSPNGVWKCTNIQKDLSDKKNKE